MFSKGWAGRFSGTGGASFARGAVQLSISLLFFTGVVGTGCGGKLQPSTLKRTTSWQGEGADVTPCSKPWVYFDLGNTLVDASNGDKLHYFEGSLSYLKLLQQEGFTLGLIVNVPDTWGETRAKKLQRLRLEISKGWKESDPFDWTLFDVVLVPRSDTERKPAPELFREAKALAGGCRVVYQGEDAQEMPPAVAEGFATYQVGLQDRAFYFPLEDLLKL